MTAYWPTFAVARCLTPAQRLELMNTKLGISYPTMTACHKATNRIPACTSLVVIASEGAEVRRAYLQHPSFEQWVALERGGFIEIWDGFGFIMDALH